MKRKPDGREVVIRGEGSTYAEAVIDAPPPPRLKAQPAKIGVPLSHGKHSEAQIAAWKRECLKRRGIDVEEMEDDLKARERR